MPESDFNLVNKWKRYSLVLAVLDLIVGLLGLAGWILDLSSFRSGLSQVATMKVNTAISLILSGTCLIFLHRRQRVMVHLLVIPLLLLAVLTLVEYIWSLDLGIDQWWYLDKDASAQSGAPGRMSILTAIGFIGFGTSVLMLFWRWVYGAQLLAALLLILAYASLLGHIFGVVIYYQFGRYSAIAPHTSLGLLCLAFGLLFFEPNRAWMRTLTSRYIGGILARYAFSFLLAVGPLLISLYLYSLHHWRLSPELGIVTLLLLATFITFPLAYLLLQRINRLDAQLQQSNENLQISNQALLASNQELASTLEELKVRNRDLADSTRALARKNEELQHLNQDLDTVVYMASHDLKTPINNLEALLAELRQIAGPLLTPEDAPLLDFAGKSVGQLKATISRLTELVRTQNTASAHKEQLTFTRVLKDLQHELKSEIETSHAHLHLNLKVDTIYFSYIHLRSILYNLFSNAIKYRSPDRPPHISCCTSKTESGVELIFSDNGLGVPTDQVPRLFSLFKRLHHHVEGSGIGLYLVKRIIENQGGTIRVESREGAGTTFILHFPDYSMTSTG